MQIMTQERNPWLMVREKSIEMSQLSDFGTEVALAKMRNANPVLNGYLESLHPIVPTLVVPIHNAILLEYEVQRKRMPQVSDKTLEEFEANQANRQHNLNDFQNEQPNLLKTVTSFLEVLRGTDFIVADAARVAIYDTLYLLREQARKDLDK